MVRAIVGTLVEVGRGKLSVEGFRKVIEEKNRCSAGTSVPGHALFWWISDIPTIYFRLPNLFQSGISKNGPAYPFCALRG